MSLAGALNRSNDFQNLLFWVGPNVHVSRLECLEISWLGHHKSVEARVVTLVPFMSNG